MKRLIVSLLIILSNLNLTAWAFFLDPLGIFVSEINDEKYQTDFPIKEEVEKVDTRTADFNSSFLIIGKTIYLSNMRSV